MTVPLQRRVARSFRDLEQPAVVELLASPFHEARLTALLILSIQFAKADHARRAAIVRLYLDNLQAVNNWDLVDLSAPKILGAWLLEQPAGERALLYRFARSGHLWRQRIAMLATLPLIKAQQFADTLALAEILLHHEHDLIHKAVGWMLREVGKRDLEAEVAFLRRTYRTMPRTMLRYAIEKFAPELRLKFLHGCTPPGLTTWQPVAKLRLHSSGAASRLAALLLSHIFQICSLVTPCQPGTSPLSVRRRVPPRAAMDRCRAGPADVAYPPRTTTRSRRALGRLLPRTETSRPPPPAPAI